MKKIKYRIYFRPKFINYHQVINSYGSIIPLPMADYTYHKYDGYCELNTPCF